MPDNGEEKEIFWPQFREKSFRPKHKLILLPTRNRDHNIVEPRYNYTVPEEHPDEGVDRPAYMSFVMMTDEDGGQYWSGGEPGGMQSWCSRSLSKFDKKAKETIVHVIDSSGR